MKVKSSKSKTLLAKITTLCSLLSVLYSLYSYLNATIGCKFAARKAGYKPKNTPIANAKKNANNIESIVMTAVSAPVSETSDAIATPNKIPMMPPNTLNVTVSIKN